ncbi:uncharacterized protein LY89DRAFT_689663 [Mollisia scopiformis]|uniref:Kelch repeat protein n=1 Tax=Mollisia scopiformis TaxID=149040 RepID=A0A132BFB0_MOLSC|nr:uncharacterized protein LY89DRAFT_689663 [Mollisia scopiformis]KUJ10397.1 hypothetical protein LY89DRAFT_689663 [Mollisia scopiformis]
MFRSLLAAGLFARLCAAQQSGWQTGQVNATMCYWDSPRAAVVRDTLYIDGGALWWTPGMSDGTYGPPTSDDNPLGIVYQLNFSTPFNTTAQTNISNVFTTQSKAAAGGAANNVAPNYYDGVMMANDYEWFIYGGLITQTAEYTLPDSQSAAAYEVYASGPPKQFKSGYILETLTNGLTRYVTNGAGVSVPSENLGFYFGGLRSASFGPIYYQTGNETYNADVLSDTMIELDMTVQTQETWKNISLPTTVPGRINAELVWVPVSEQGVLVAIGGVVDAEYAELDTVLDANQTADTKLKSPGLMNTVAVYDIATGSWYEQPTSEQNPGMLTQGCTVMASAQDGSSHNIYWYGGWQGIDSTQPFNDDVWVLSIPTFMWMKVSSGTTGHGRAGHRCVKPYPDQMFVVGGYAPLTGTIPQCVSGNIIQVFNLSTATWITNYDPAVWSNYTVPSMISSMIGGTGTGSATHTQPSPSGFANASMTGLFGAAYNTSKITTWYPYHAAASTSPPGNITTITPTPKSGSGTPSYLGPVLGVVLGLFFLTLAIVAFLIWRRRHLFRSSAAGGQSENGTMDNRRWVTNWLRATPADAKAPTVTTDETPVTPYPYEEDRQEMAEVQGQQVFEMMDTSRLVELGANPDTGTGLHPIPMAQVPPHSPSPSSPRSQNLAPSNSITSTTTTSTLSRPPVSPVLQNSPRLDGPGQGREKFISGMSQLSDSDRGHLRGISETSVSTEGGGGVGFVTPLETPGALRGLGAAGAGGGEGRGEGSEGMVPTKVPTPPLRGTAVSPLTPPQGTGREGGDYLNASGGGSASPGAVTRRRSNFSEELGEDGR